MVAAAHWWDRLRLDATALAPDELRLARAANAAVGRAIRDARSRREHPEPAYIAPVGEVIPFPQADQRMQRAMLGVAAFTVAALLVVVFLLPNLRSSPAPAAAPPLAQTAVATLSPSGGRGRTSQTLPPVAAVVPAATPVPTPVPSETPLPATPAPVAEAAPPVPAAPAPVTAPAADGQSGGVPNGIAGGAPNGVPNGQPNGNGTVPISTPPPPPAHITPEGPPPPPAQGSERFYFRVLDLASRQPMPNVCVIFGQYKECNYTNSAGEYWIVVPANNSRWFFLFSYPGYVLSSLYQSYEPSMGRTPSLVYLHH